jgi:hypothetical protein
VEQPNGLGESFRVAETALGLGFQEMSEWNVSSFHCSIVPRVARLIEGLIFKNPLLIGGRYRRRFFWGGA